MKTGWVIVAALMVLATLYSASATTPDVAIGQKVGNDVQANFQYGTLRISPETATSSNDKDFNFQQSYIFTNTHTQPLYVFYAFYMNGTLSAMRINTSTEATLQQLSKGGSQYYFNKQGMLLNSGKTQTITFNYTTTNETGKFYAAVMASTVDDYTCIATNTCTFFYAVDPYYEIGPTGGANNQEVGDQSAGGSYRVYQSFRLDCATATCAINEINHTLAKQGTPAGSVTIAIYHNSSSAPGTQLFNSTSLHTASGLSTTYSNWSFAFDNTTVILNDTTQYFIVGISTATQTSGNYIKFRRDSSTDVYAYGSSAGLIDGTVWTARANDIEFNISYSDVSAGANANDTLNINYTCANTNIYEGLTTECLLNFTAIGENISISNVSTIYNNTEFVMALRSTSGSGNTTMKIYNASYIRAPLVGTNNTAINYTFKFNYTTTNNGSNLSNTTATNGQSVLWGFFPSIFTSIAQLLETQLQNISIIYSMLGNTSGVTFTFNAMHNTTNRSLTFLGNGTSAETYQTGFNTPFISGVNATINSSAWMNVTFGGMTLSRNNTVYQAQTVFRALLENCTQGNTTTRTLNITIQDLNGTVINATSSTVNLTVWTSNASANRTHVFTFAGNNTPQVCLYPTNATYNSTLEIQAVNAGFEDINITATPTLSSTSQNFTLNMTARTNTVIAGGGGGSSLESPNSFSSSLTTPVISLQTTKTCLAFSKAPKCSIVLSSNQAIRNINTSLEVERGVNVLNVATLSFFGNSKDFFQERVDSVLIDGVSKTVTLQVYNFNTTPVYIAVVFFFAVLAFSAVGAPKVFARA